MREKLIKTKRTEAGKTIIYKHVLDFNLHPLSGSSKCTLGKFAHKTYEVILLSKAQILLLFVMKFA